MRKIVFVFAILMSVFLMSSAMADVNVYPGNIVVFGHYEQDGNLNNGPEEIEWEVVSCDEDIIVMISKYGLDCVPYHAYEGGATWENCTLRYWLNQTFLNTALTPSQQNLLCSVQIANLPNPEFGTYAGATTWDKVFIPGVQDIEMGFESFSMQTRPTRYAMQMGAHDDDEGRCWWWLRTPGKRPEKATHVTYKGKIYMEGTTCYGTSGTVRPCIVLNRKML